MRFDVGTLRAMRGALPAAALLAALVLPAVSATPAVAGTLYRCDGADGVPSYVSRRIPGATCTVVSRYTPARAAVSKPSTPSRPAAPAAAGSADSTATPVATTPAQTEGPAPVHVKPAAPPPGKDGRRVVSGQVYSYMKDGVRHYTSAAPKQVAGVEGLRTIRYSFIETCFACGAAPGVDFGRLRLNTESVRAEIAAAAREFGVEEAVIRAIMHAESAYNPMAVSHAGAQGLMQLMPATASRFGVSNPYDAAQNIRGGVEYLAWLLKRYSGNLTLAAAGYNAGEGAGDRHGGVPPYQETQRYVQRVALLAERYRSVIGATGGAR